MDLIQTFSGTLERDFRGNIVYSFHLPEGLKKLSVTLTHGKEHLTDVKKYLCSHKDELSPVLDRYLETSASESQLCDFVSSIKTEIQLCLMINGKFAGNVHMPGEKKEMLISESSATRGCVPCKSLRGMAKVIVNVFHTAEDDTPYLLEIRGEFGERCSSAFWKRIELHNHTIESDGIMTANELVSCLASNGVRAFSLTDHNTISGWSSLESACRSALTLNAAPSLEYIQGFELTSYYGHLLCQNVSSYIPWDDIDENNADLLFQRVHEAGGLAGPAHPFSVPFPFSTGMRWSMKIHDFRLVDFIEIINNAHPMVPDNRNAILWWEQLIFDGFPIAPVSGQDLHRPQSLEGTYTTHIAVAPEDAFCELADQLSSAIRGCRTCVTRGPVADWTEQDGVITVFLEQDAGQTHKAAGPDHVKLPEYLCQFRTSEKILTLPMTGNICTICRSELAASAHSAVILIYEGYADWNSLTAVARPVFF